VLRHLVLLTFNHGATDEQCAAVISELRTLPQRIPSVLAVEVYRNAALAEGSSDIAVRADFADADAFRQYNDHPEHHRTKEFIGAYTGQRSAIEYFDA
jgi:hypothetical protein